MKTSKVKIKKLLAYPLVPFQFYVVCTKMMKLQQTLTYNNLMVKFIFLKELLYCSMAQRKGVSNNWTYSDLLGWPAFHRKWCYLQNQYSCISVFSQRTKICMCKWISPFCSLLWIIKCHPVSLHKFKFNNSPFCKLLKKYFLYFFQIEVKGPACCIFLPCGLCLMVYRKPLALHLHCIIH